MCFLVRYISLSRPLSWKLFVYGEKDFDFLYFSYQFNLIMQLDIWIEAIYMLEERAFKWRQSIFRLYYYYFGS